MNDSVSAVSAANRELVSEPRPRPRAGVGLRLSAPELSPRLVSRAVVYAQGGDREALRFLYARYAEDVYGCVRGIVQDDREAEEVTGRVFGELVDAIGAYEEREVSFVAWIVGVARSIAIEHIDRDHDPA
jgi:hypothetical protein